MSQQDNAAIARSFFEAWNERDYERGQGLMSEDGELVEIATGETFQGSDGVREEYDKWANAFPDGRVEIRNSFSGGDWVAVECRFEGTNTGTFVSGSDEIPPTGRSLNFDFCTIAEIRGGKIGSIRHYHDNATIAQRLGLMPAGAGATA